VPRAAGWVRGRPPEASGDALAAYRAGRKALAGRQGTRKAPKRPRKR